MVNPVQQATGGAGDILPPELIHHIVSCIAGDKKRPRQVSKRGLAACSLACRHWARSIVPVLFQHITLRSADDIATFKGFLDSPHCLEIMLPKCIEQLTIQYVGPQARPWLHHLADLWTRLPANLVHKVYIDNATVRPRYLSYPSYGSFPLPRSLPSSYYSPIRRLSVSNLILNSKYSLFSLLDSLPALRQCSCSNISFRNPERTSYRRPLARRSQTFRWVECTGGEDGSLQAQIDLCTAVLEPHTRARLALEDWKVVQRVASILAPAVHRTVCMSFDAGTSSATESRYKLGIVVADELSKDDDPDSQRDNNLTAVHAEVAAPHSPAAELGKIQSTKVHLYGASGGRQPLDETQYATFEDTLHELAEVPRAEIKFMAEQTAAFKQLVSAVVDGALLGRLRDAGRLDVRHVRTATDLGFLLRLPAEYAVDGETVVLGVADRFDYFQLYTDDQERLLRAALARTRDGASSRARYDGPLTQNPIIRVPVRFDAAGRLVVDLPMTIWNAPV